MRSNFFWSAGLGLGMLACALYYVGVPALPADVAEIADAVLPDAFAGSDEAAPPVLVVIVETQAHLELLRQAFGRRTVLQSTKGAFAIEDTVFASDLEAVSAPLNALGWAERPLSIVSRERRVVDVPRDAGTPGGLGDSGRKGLSLAEIARKDSLSRAEAQILLDRLEDPLLFQRR
jgi:hypothetical protein